MSGLAFQMNWAVELLNSTFVGGIVIGLLLAVVVARASIWFESYQRRRLACALCMDLVRNISDLIQNLEDNRARHRVIDHEFLETITAEIFIYGRNREHLILISDRELRIEIRDFFNRVAALLAQIRGYLRQFYDANHLGQSMFAKAHLDDAHDACDRLGEMKDRPADRRATDPCRAGNGDRRPQPAGGLHPPLRQGLAMAGSTGRRN